MHLQPLNKLTIITAIWDAMEIFHRYGSRAQHLGTGSYLTVTNANLQTVTSDLRHAPASTRRESLLLARRRDYQVDTYIHPFLRGHLTKPLCRAALPLLHHQERVDSHGQRGQEAGFPCRSRQDHQGLQVHVLLLYPCYWWYD
jgi:hypothetical protein